MHTTKYLIALAAAIGPILGQLITVPLLPSVDPFYQPPAGFASKAPGSILRSRKVTTSYFGLIANPVQTWQLLYRTTAINGSAIATVTTVFKPLVPINDSFVSFHTAYDGAARSGVCDPSYNYQLTAPQVDLISSVEFFLLEAYLQDGYIVSSPDYEGPDSAFSAGRLAGTGVLDSMRAVANFRTTLGFSTSTPKVVGYGYSGGAIATGWAASLQPKYAPEINVKGWAMGGTPANLTGTAVYIDGTAFAGFLPQALAGLISPSAYGAQLQPLLASDLTAYGKATAVTAEEICGTENLFVFGYGQVASSTFSTLGTQFFYQPTIASVLRNNIMGQNASETPKAPVYMFHATQDEIIPYANATTLYSEWCAYGASVQFVTIANGGHATTEIIGFPGAYAFVNAAFAGTTAIGCSQSTTFDDTLNPIVLGTDLEPITTELLNGLVIAGRKDVNIQKNITLLSQTFA